MFEQGRADFSSVRPVSCLLGRMQTPTDLLLPRMIAPASRKRLTRKASSDGTEPASIIDPAVVGMSAVSMLSFKMIGMPCSADRAPLAFLSAPRLLAISTAFGFTVIYSPKCWALLIVGIDAGEECSYKLFRS
jgi:hypothetical protein